MLLAIDKFGGLVPRVKDPSLLPSNKAQLATNATFDEGGVRPYKGNLFDSLPGKALPATIFRYYGDSQTVFFTWTTDVDAIKPPIPGDAYNRIFYTENGELRVTDNDHFDVGGTAYPMEYHLPSPPAPTAAPVVTGTPVGPDPTLLETRGYVYTFVNSYGAEGPPSPVSNLLDIYDGNTVTVSGMSTAPDALYDVLYKRIYRLNQASGGYAEYQFVEEIAVATTSYSDTTLDSALSEVLQSTEWDGAPAGMQGLISLPNGVCAGFVGNILCLSVPGFPHAWPVSYQKTMDTNIVGLGAFGTTIVVLTEGIPYLNVGNDPSNTVTERVQGFKCLSKTGIVQAGEAVIYPSPEGLVAIGPGGSELITWDVLTPDDWSNYAPETIKAYYWQGKYVAFYTRGTAPHNTMAGFIFDLKTKDLVPLDFYASAGYYDKADGTLYLVEDDEIVCFAESENDLLELDVAPATVFGVGQIIVGETSRATATVVTAESSTRYYVKDCTGTFILGEVVGVGLNTADQGALYPVLTPRDRTLVYETKRYRVSMGAFSLVKVLAELYPVDVDIIYPKIPRALHVTVVSDKPQRMKAILTDTVEVKIHGKGLSIIFLASAMEEFPV